MAVFSITYDLKAPDRDYTSLHDHLKKYEFCKCMESYWLVDSNKSAAQLYSEIAVHIDSNDILFVSQLNKHWHAVNFSCASWLKDPKRSW